MFVIRAYGDEHGIIKAIEQPRYIFPRRRRRLRHRKHDGLAKNACTLQPSTHSPERVQRQVICYQQHQIKTTKSALIYVQFANVNYEGSVEIQQHFWDPYRLDDAAGGISLFLTECDDNGPRTQTLSISVIICNTHAQKQVSTVAQTLDEQGII